MSISFGLGVKLSTSQKLTPQMQQAIKLLQLSNLELAQEVQNKLDNNPLLEREEETYEDEKNALDTWNDNSWQDPKSNTKDTKDTDFQPEFEDDISDKLTQSNLDGDAMDTNWEDLYTHDDLYTHHTNPTNPDLDDLDPQGSTTSCIQDHIRWQINFKHLSETDTLIADYLIDAMDDTGFIQIDLQELQQSFATIASFYQWEDEISLAEIQTVLKIIQSCDPIGVGARDLAECLSLQLLKLDPTTPNRTQALTLLKFAHHLTTNNIKALMEDTQLQADEIKSALDLIRTLNPSPAQQFISQQPHHALAPESYDIPDILVTPIPNRPNQTPQWQVRLNPETLPRLKINQEYANLIQKGKDTPSNTYLKEHLTDARLFIRSIEERNQNLLKVATCIIQRQYDFLEKGATAMQPLILQDIADEVGLHESTVSRLTSSKTILTPQGLFSLKYFFSSSVSGQDGDVSSTAICAMIKQMIAEENPKKPLSDNTIQKRLKEAGIDLARRTVSKYRESMNIGSSTQRRQHL